MADARHAADAGGPPVTGARERAVLDQLDELVYEVDASGCLRYANAAWLRLLGRAPASLVGTAALDCVAAADRRRIAAVFARLRRGRLPAWRGDVDLLAADGSTQRFAATARALEAAPGERGGAVGTLRHRGAHEDYPRQLDAERRLLQDVVDGLPFAVSIKALDDRFILVNRHLAHLLGAEPAQLRGRPALAQGPPEFAPQLRPLDERAATGERVEFDFEHALTGRPRTSRVGKLRVQVGADQTPAILTYAFDISEQQQAATELRRQRAFLRAVIDGDEDCIYVKDAAGRYVLVNHAFLDCFGLEEDAVLGRTMDEVFGGAPSIERSQAADEAVRRTGRIDVVEQTLATPRGPRQMLIRRAPIAAPAGGTWLLGVGRDVTGLRSQEERLRRQWQFMREVIDQVPSQIFVRGADLRYTLVNTALARLLERSPESVVGRDPRELVDDPQEIEPMLATDRRVLDENIEVVQEETLTLHGRRHHFSTMRRPIVAPDGSRCLLGISTDITELRMRELLLRETAQAAAAASEAKSRFLANMSHELRTPMNGVLGMIDLALRAGFARDRERFLAMAQSSAQALLAVVDDILDVSKIEAGMMTVEQLPFSLYELLREVSWAWAARAEEKGLLLLNRFGIDLPLRPCGDPTRLRQVLNNLLGNAIKFTPAGRVTLDVAVEGVVDGAARLRFGVTDSGPGIAPEQQARIFEAFAQADESVTRRFGGTGLGLTISARLVELMGGQLALDSDSDAGASFSFVLPMPMAADEDGHYAPMLRHLPPTRILWIDPCTDCRVWFDRMLTRWGATVTAVASVADALAGGGADYGVIAIDHAAFEAERASWTALLERAPRARVCMLLPLTQALPLAIAALGDRATALTKPLLPLELHRALGSASAPAAAAAAPAAGTTPGEQPLRGLRVLLVEDNEINRSLAQSLLGLLGAEVRAVADGAQALEVLAGGRFDLVLMDVQMPVLDGLAAVARLRAAEAVRAHGARMPVIAMTAHAIAGDRERLLASGFDGYVAKPFRPEDLVREIRRLVPAAAGARAAARGSGAPPPVAR